MCRINLCCCCCSLRIGTYLSAAYTIVLGLISGIIVAVAAGTITWAKGVISTHSKPDDNSNVVLAGATIAEIIFYVALTIYLLWIITAIIMIVGTAKSQRGYLIPWIVMTIILTIFAAIQILISLFAISLAFSSAATGMSFCINIALFFLNCYSLTAVLSFYKDHCVDNDEGRAKNVV